MKDCDIEKYAGFYRIFEKAFISEHKLQKFLTTL